MVCTLMLNTSDAHEFFYSSGKLMLEFENNVLYTITKITLDKLRIFYNAFSKFKEISHDNYENLIKILKRLERAKKDLETLVNVESMEEGWSTFKIYISEVLEIFKQLPEISTSEEFRRLEKFLEESEKREKNLSKRSLLGGIITSGVEEKAEKEYFFKVLSETQNVLENIKKRGLFHDLCNELGKLLPEILEIQPHELIKDISLKLREFTKELLQPQSSDTVGTKESFSFASEKDSKNEITNKND